MKFLCIIYLSAGFMMAILSLRIFHGEFDDILYIALATAVPNVLTGLLAYLVFRQNENDFLLGRILPVASWILGFCCGGYFYFT